MSLKNSLLNGLESNNLNLRNRVAMAPLTRSRATVNNLPTPLMKTYYEQRSSAGLIISEAAPISEMGIGYLRVPGIFTKDQIKAWKNITEGVHKKDGQIFMQLWHVGRNSHPDFLSGKSPVSASAIALNGNKETPLGLKPYTIPKALSMAEINKTIKDYANAAANAIDAGFDGVQIHAANGYLIDQFLNDNTNFRNDAYGGSIENKCRLAIEICDAVCSSVGHEKVAIRLSPIGISGQVFNQQPIETHQYLVKMLNNFDLAFLEILESLVPIEKLPGNYPSKALSFFRPIYNGVLMSNGGYSAEFAENEIRAGLADIISFGKAYISNPDLVKRIENNWPLEKWNKDTFYSEGPEGYIDYPFYDETQR